MTALEPLPPSPRFTEAKRAALDAFERDYFTRLRDAALGNVSEMARLAGMERTHVRAYLERHGIGRPARPGRPRDPAKVLAELAAVLAPRDGETLVDAAARAVAGATSPGKKGRAK